mmetsp:Transcript_2169/g.5756  ORF Transcript_2169/g.5756 Transcript_2169/m.5756 type:complete len:237 (+) Transcript_2169:369-1079(+)
MCKRSSGAITPSSSISDVKSSASNALDGGSKEPSLLARYTCASVLTAFLAVWCKFTFVPENEQPGVGADMQSWHTPALLTLGYLVSLPLLRTFTEKVLAPRYDLKALLTESMVLYNVAQVILNGWTVWKIIDAVWFRGHPFIGDIHTISGASYAVWVHYCDKYLEFFDTYFMVLRGKMNQVRCSLQSPKLSCTSYYSSRGLPSRYAFIREQRSFPLERSAIKYCEHLHTLDFTLVE